MQINKWWLLQLFADGGEGGSAGGEGAAATATGENDAAAGHQRLRELGVPEHKIRKNRSYGFKPAVQAPAAAEQGEAPAENPKQDDAAKPTEAEAPKRMTWDEIKADPEYSKEIQNVIKQRLKNSKAAEDSLSKLAPALETLARTYGMDPDNIDHAALAEKIQGDNKLYEERALELGVEPEVARKMDQFDLMQARQKRQQEQNVKDQAMQQHYASLLQQSEALKGKYPGFDLQAELKNPTFARLTAPGVNIGVEDAYYLIHRKEIEQAALQETAKRTAQHISNAVRSGTLRPDENGTASHAPSVTTFDYRTASREQREALKARIRQAGARGEKIYPGQ